jgi:hypothetical protein
MGEDDDEEGFEELREVKNWGGKKDVHSPTL